MPLEEQIQKAYANGYDKETLDLNEKDLSVLGSYLRKMCVVEPSKRATVAELMSHPWIKADEGINGEE